MATTDTAPILLEPFPKYPPFPRHAAGKTIKPFVQFQPEGICVRAGADKVEVDALGVATVKLGVVHLHPSEKKGKKAGRATVTDEKTGRERKVLWHEEWEQRESLNFACDPRMLPFDRLWESHVEFKDRQPWPPTTSPVRDLWEQIRLYIGLIANIQPPPSKKPKKNVPVVGLDEDNEDQEDETTQPKELDVDMVENDALDQQIAADKEADAEKAARSLVDDEARELRQDMHEAKKTQRLQEFLYDSENTVKIFFSAHYRDTGLMWNKNRGEDGPRLFAFFLRFLIRNNVFPEPEIAQGLQRALVVCELAIQELPATFVMSKALEDGVGNGFQALFGKQMTDTFTLGLWGDEDENEAESEESEAGEKPDAKKPRLEDTETFGADEMNVDVHALKDAIADNVDLPVAVEPMEPVLGNAWVAQSPWDSAEPVQSPWDKVEPAQESSGAWADGGALWDVSGAPSKDLAWDTGPKENALLHLLGMTALPFTHTTGIVERSTRHIVRVIPPAPSTPRTKKRGDAAAVEEEIEARMGCIVLAPFKKIGNHVASDIMLPVIQMQSRGAVVSSDGEAQQEPTAQDGFNPHKDEIKLLVKPETLAHVTLNMGLTATWVQLARKDTSSNDQDESKRSKGQKREAKKGAPGKNGEPTDFWYMEQLASVLSSFHMDRYYPDQA